MLGLLAFGYLYPFPYVPRIQNPNENVRLFMTAALAERGEYAINPIRARWGWVNDAALLDGKVFSVKAPATSLLAVPAYAVWFHASNGRDGWRPDRLTATWIARFFGCIAPMLLFFWCLLPWLGRRTRSPVLRDAIWWSLALGSCLYGYTLIFVSHATGAAAGFGALMLLSRARPQLGEPGLGTAGMFVAGLLAAAVTAFEYPGFPISLLLCVYGIAVAGSVRRAAVLCAGALVPVAFVLHFHAVAFGSPFTPGHLYMENQAFRAVHHKGFFGADQWYAEAAERMLFDPGFGLLPLTPIFAAAAIGAVVVLSRPRRRWVGLIAALSAAAAYLLACHLSNWRGGWTIGPRYLCWVLPMVGWLALEGLDAAHRRVPFLAEAFAIGALAAGLVASGVPSAIYPHLPEDLLYPLPQAMWPLLSGGFVPLTAANLAGMTGPMTMVPLALLAGVVVWGTAFADWTASSAGTAHKRGGPWARLALATVISAALVITPVRVPDDLSEHARTRASDALRFMKKTWPAQGRPSTFGTARYKAQNTLP